MASILIKNVQLINEGMTANRDVFIKDGRIEKVASEIGEKHADREIDGNGKCLLPGVIDDQVHFREPGLTNKAEIKTEARAAVAGGITSYMEMPNTKPPTTEQDKLQDKFEIARQRSLANYSFYFGATNDNLDEVLKTDPANVCGIKIFMGSSTGNMLVDDDKALENIFSQSPMLIATHCEDEQTVSENEEIYRQKYGENVPMKYHPLIRSIDACYRSSSKAVELARKHNTRLHILHLTTEDELALFDHDKPLEEKRITAEACVHHLWFTSDDYERLGAQIKCNPAIKKQKHRDALVNGLVNNNIDVIATDHAPHTLEEKHQTYFNAPAGIPLIQHPLYMMLELYHQKKLSLERLVDKMCHSPAVCFKVQERGYIREGYWADLVLVDLRSPWKVDSSNIYYKSSWSPLQNKIFNSQITHTFVNGHLAYQYDGQKVRFHEDQMGRPLTFDAQ